MPKLTSPLDNVRIASPCPVEWDQMFSFEDQRVRFCSQCNLNVYNLSDMSRHEAEALITKTEGRLCVRFYRKSDGSILTQNCPVGLKAIKRRAAWAAQVVLGMVLSFVSGLGFYIYHLGRKPFPSLDNLSIFGPKPVIMGAIVLKPRLEFPPHVGEPKPGKIKIEPRQPSLDPQNRAKGQAGNQQIIQDE